jgi:DNA-binding IclR family transcriptional regulator
MIKALQRERFLVQDKVSGSYALGPTIMNLARVMLQRSDRDELVTTVMPHMDRMRTITSETVGLHIPMGDLRLCVAELVSRQPIRSATGVGRTFPLPDGASGQILAAWSNERLEMAEARLQASEGGRKNLDPVWKRVRKNQYAVNEDETIPGASALAFPLFGPNREVVAAIDITGPATRWTRSEMLTHLEALSQEIAHVSEQLGHSQ